MKKFKLYTHSTKLPLISIAIRLNLFELKFEYFLPDQDAKREGSGSAKKDPGPNRYGFETRGFSTDILQTHFLAQVIMIYYI